MKKAVFAAAALGLILNGCASVPTNDTTNPSHDTPSTPQIVENKDHVITMTQDEHNDIFRKHFTRACVKEESDKIPQPEVDRFVQEVLTKLHETNIPSEQYNDIVVKSVAHHFILPIQEDCAAKFENVVPHIVPSAP